MVDWGKLGKQALDISKKAGEKGLDSFNEWRTDEERIQRKKEDQSQKKIEKNYEPLRSKHIKFNEITGEFELLGQMKAKFTQEDLLSYELLQDESMVSKGGVSIGRSIVGNVIAGPAGLIVGGLSGKKEINNVVKSIKIILSIKDKKGKISHREIPIYSGKGIKLSDPLYQMYIDKAKDDLMILDKIADVE